MGKYCLNLRHRALLDESVEKKYELFCESLMEFNKPWGLKEIPSPNIKLYKGELCTIFELNDLSSRGLKSYIQYPLRSEKYLKDKAQYDDIVIIEFRDKNKDLSSFVKDIFPCYVKSFDCYRASIISRDLSANDWPVIVEQCNSTGNDVDGRDSVYRINEINFFDKELCKRAFRLTPEEVVKKLKGKVESVDLFDGGVILVYSSTLLPIEELEEIDAKVKGWLGCS